MRAAPASGAYFLGLTGGRMGLAAGQLNITGQLAPVITLAADGRSAKARWRTDGPGRAFTARKPTGAAASTKTNT